MKLRTVMILIAIAFVIIVIALQFFKKASPSALKFLILLGIMAMLFCAILFLKKKLTEKHSWN